MKNEIEIDGIKYIKKDEILKIELQKPIEGTPFIVGANYMLRTITMIYTGKLVAVYNKYLVLTNVAWIADTGRWADTVKTGDFNEVEPYPEKMRVNINVDTLLDSFIVDFDLPKNQK